MWKIREDLANLAGAIFGGAKVNLRTDCGLPLVTLGDLLGEILCVLFTNEVDGAASKPTASHASPAKAGQALRGFNHHVEFPATNLVEIAQAGVRLMH
jgi:hypothetical protein